MSENITAPADGLALPKLNRRAALGALATLPAMAGATALPVALAATAAATISDPLADLLAELIARRAEFRAIPSEMITEDNEEDLIKATYGPASDRLWNETPQPTTLRGVAEAMRYAIEEDAFIDYGAEKVIKAALAFLDSGGGPMNDLGSIRRPVHPLGFETKNLPIEQLAALVDALQTVSDVLGALREQPRFAGDSTYNQAGRLLEDLHDQINCEIDDVWGEVEGRSVATVDEAEWKFGILVRQYSSGCDNPANAIAEMAKLAAEMDWQVRKGGAA
ncbi:hypothetical protein [Mesorhizobium sp. WSM4887]|uniref:hypothetical protein n=1 Tax=Mesorhizobium sp. WSM4887 TaxID=3038543 RepID=UPI0024166BEF|nr:hypothetical protein [Mesorhizobium sp. WSM4887]MDG4889291.1 hypothetical protein [Mesorhizobium sp. WSM4887]